MLSVLEEPAIRARAFLLSVEAYHHLFDLGEVPENFELIRGVVVQKMPKSPLHSSIVELLSDHFSLSLPQGWFVRQEQPVTLSDSEPEPDIAIVRGARGDFFRSHPQIADVIVEVCVSSEAIDRLKLELYAEAGVPECWLVLAEERVLERHTDPQGSAYRQVERITSTAPLPSTVFPDLTLPPAGLFGA
jgi:Uma2 family endonuclease